MGKYVKNERINANSTKVISNSVEIMTIAERYKKFNKDFFKDYLLTFLNGKQFVDGTTNEPFKLFDAPKFTGSRSNDFTNLITYFTEYTKAIDAKYNTDYYLQFNNVVSSEYITRINNIKNTHYPANDNIDRINEAIDSKELSKLDEYNLYQEALIKANSRKKPYWFQFIEKSRRKDEQKALDRMKEHLKSRGISNDVLDNAEEGISYNNDEFKKYTKTTIDDRLRKYESDVRKNIADLNKKKITNKEFITNMAKLNYDLKQAHEKEKNVIYNNVFDANVYNQEETHINHLMDTIFRSMNLKDYEQKAALDEYLKMLDVVDKFKDLDIDPIKSNNIVTDEDIEIDKADVNNFKDFDEVVFDDPMLDISNSEIEGPQK